MQVGPVNPDEQQHDVLTATDICYTRAAQHGKTVSIWLDYTHAHTLVHTYFYTHSCLS